MSIHNEYITKSVPVCEKNHIGGYKPDYKTASYNPHVEEEIDEKPPCSFQRRGFQYAP